MYFQAKSRRKLIWFWARPIKIAYFQVKIRLYRDEENGNFHYGKKG